MKTVDFSETIAASDLKIGRCRQLIEFMKVLKVTVKVISLPYIFQVLYVLCFSRPRYQVSVYRTIGPLVSYYTPRKLCLWEGILFSRCPSERSTDRPSECASVTFCFLNILENH